MSQTSFLLQDILTLLSLVANNDIHPIGSNYLPPSALKQLNPLLTQSDILPLHPIRNVKGQWDKHVRTSASERHSPRIRWVHYLADSAHLIARAGLLLKPTPRLTRWLNASPDQRAQILFQSAFPPHPTQEDEKRWRAFGLPGKHLPAPLATLKQLLDVFRQIPTSQTFTNRVLIKLLAMPHYDDEAQDDQPANVLAAWLDLLQSFEIITKDQAHQVTPFGAHLIKHPNAKLYSFTPKTKPLHWSPLHETQPPSLVAPLDAQPATIFALGEYAIHLATLSSSRHTRCLFQLDETRIRRALDQDKTIAQICDFLEHATHDALPRVVSDWLYRIGGDYGHIALRSAVLLETDEPALLSKLTHTQTIRQCIRRTLSPRAVVVQPSHVKRLTRYLERNNYHPRLELANQRATPKPFDQATLAHLYISARLVHQLHAFMPGSYSPPYSIIQDLSQQLSAHDRAIADEIISEAQNENTRHHRLQSVFVGPATESALAETKPQNTFLPIVETAIEKNTPLEMTYHSPYGEGTTHRLIEPLRVEYRRTIPYLIAYCHLANGERTFRLERILELAACPESQTRQRRIVPKK
jgi:hypothetical protein